MEPEKISAQFAQEVAAINTEIAARREHIDTGIETHEQVAKEALANAISTAARSAHTAAATPSHTTTTSYLDQTDEQTAQEINMLIGRIHEKGLAAAIAEAREQSPYILDAFHDALIEKLYGELKSHNLL